MIVVLSLAVLLAIGLAPVAVDLADEWFERRAWICDMERAWHPCEGRAPERPVRPELEAAAAYARRQAERAVRRAERLERWRLAELRNACRWEHRRDLAVGAMFSSPRVDRSTCALPAHGAPAGTNQSTGGDEA